MASSTESWTFSGSYSITCEAVGEAVAAVDEGAAALAVDAAAAGAAAGPVASEPPAAVAAEDVLRFPFFFLVKGTLTASSIQ